MHGTGGSRPSKPISVFSALVGVGMVVVVVLFFAGGPEVGVPCFIALWIVVALGGVLYHIANAASSKGVNTGEFDFKVDGLPRPDSGRSDADEPDFAERLRDLEQLRSDGLINEDEYQAKRREIMADKW